MKAHPSGSAQHLLVKNQRDSNRRWSMAVVVTSFKNIKATTGKMRLIALRWALLFDLLKNKFENVP